MRRIRIGNDIQVSWEVKTGGESISLEGRQLKLYVRSAYQKQEIKDFVVEGCTISFTYLASMQRITGVRAIILNDATKGSPEKTICTDQAFTLVAHSCEENDDDVDFEDFMVSLQSNIMLCSPELKNYIDDKFEEVQNYCFKLGDKGQVASPFKAEIYDFENKIQRLKNDEEYTYADITEALDPNAQQFIYDKTLDKFIRITKIKYEEVEDSGDFFRTAESLNLSHTFYIDNDKTGDTEDLDELTIKESNLFVDLPYVDTSDSIDDDTVPQYIYDATDSKWIEIVKTFYIADYTLFNTEEPLYLSHELGFSDYSTVLGNQATASGSNSTALGYGTTASGRDSTAVGNNAMASGDFSIALGYRTTASGSFSTALGYGTTARVDCSTAVGNNAKASTYSTAVGHNAKANGISSIAVGENAQASGNSSTALGNWATASGNSSTALGNWATASGNSSTAVGYKAKASSHYGVSVGFLSTAAYPESIAIGDVAKANGRNAVAIGYNTEAKLTNSLALGYSAVAGGVNAIALGKNVSNTKSIFGVGFNGVNGIDMDRDNYGLYLKGFGGYDGKNLVVKTGTTENLNPNIKSVQEIINEKADLVDGKIKSDQIPNEIIINGSNTAEDRSYYVDISEGHFAYRSAGGKTFMVGPGNIVFGNTALTEDDLNKVATKLDNITDATSAEEVVTKFNSLLADLKAKGFMKIYES